MKKETLYKIQLGGAMPAFPFSAAPGGGGPDAVVLDATSVQGHTPAAFAMPGGFPIGGTDGKIDATWLPAQVAPKNTARWASNGLQTVAPTTSLAVAVTDPTVTIWTLAENLLLAGPYGYAVVHPPGQVGSAGDVTVQLTAVQPNPQGGYDYTVSPQNGTIPPLSVGTQVIGLNYGWIESDATNGPTAPSITIYNRFSDTWNDYSAVIRLGNLYGLPDVGLRTTFGVEIGDLDGKHGGQRLTFFDGLLRLYNANIELRPTGSTVSYIAGFAQAKNPDGSPRLDPITNVPIQIPTFALYSTGDFIFTSPTESSANARIQFSQLAFDGFHGDIHSGANFFHVGLAGLTGTFHLGNYFDATYIDLYTQNAPGGMVAQFGPNVSLTKTGLRANNDFFIVGGADANTFVDFSQPGNLSGYALGLDPTNPAAAWFKMFQNGVVQLSIGDTGVFNMVGPAARMAFGVPPNVPINISTGTGLFIDRNGLRGLSANHPYYALGDLFNLPDVGARHTFGLELGDLDNSQSQSRLTYFDGALRLYNANIELRPNPSTVAYIAGFAQAKNPDGSPRLDPITNQPIQIPTFALYSTGDFLFTSPTESAANARLQFTGLAFDGFHGDIHSGANFFHVGLAGITGTFHLGNYFDATYIDLYTQNTGVDANGVDWGNMAFQFGPNVRAGKAGLRATNDFFLVGGAAANTFVNFANPGNLSGYALGTDPVNNSAGWLKMFQNGQVQLSIGDTGKVLFTGPTAYAAWGIPPHVPTSPTDPNGTGIFADRTGIYGLLNGVQQFFMDALTGKAFAGGGTITHDVNGVTITPGPAYDPVRALSFGSGGVKSADLSNLTSSSTNATALNTYGLTDKPSFMQVSASAVSTGQYATTQMSAQNTFGGAQITALTLFQHDGLNAGSARLTGGGLRVGQLTSGDLADGYLVVDHDLTVGGNVAVTGTITSPLTDPSWFNVKAYGAKGDTRSVSDGAITAGAAVLTSATASFTTADIGKKVVVRGAGASHSVTIFGVPTTVYDALDATIQTWTSATTVTLSANAATTVSGAYATFGTDDTAAINAALTAANAAGTPFQFSTVYFPKGVYGCYTFTVPSYVSLLGSDRAGSVLRNLTAKHIGDAGQYFVIVVGSGCTVAHLGIDGQRHKPNYDAYDEMGLSTLTFTKLNGFTGGYSDTTNPTAAISLGATSLTLATVSPNGHAILADMYLVIAEGANVETVQVAHTYTTGVNPVTLVAGTAHSYTTAATVTTGQNLAGGVNLTAAISSGATSLTLSTGSPAGIPIIAGDFITVIQGSSYELLRVSQTHIAGSATVALAYSTLYAYTPAALVTVGISNCSVIDCNIAGFGRDGVSFWHAFQCLTEKNYIRDNSDTGIDFPAAGSRLCKVIGNSIDTSGRYPIGIDDTAGTIFQYGQVGYIAVSGNTVRFVNDGNISSNTLYGVYLGTATNCTVVGNVLDMLRAGAGNCGILVTTGSQFHTISNNVILMSPNSTAGIKVDYSSRKDVTIANNIIQGSSQAGTGIYVSGAPYVTMVGNVINNCSNGINCDSNPGTQVIAHNDITSCVNGIRGGAPTTTGVAYLDYNTVSSCVTNYVFTSGWTVYYTGAPMGSSSLDPASVIYDLNVSLQFVNAPGAAGEYGSITGRLTAAAATDFAAKISFIRPTTTNNDQGAIAFFTNPGGAPGTLTERMRIDKDGNVGIGVIPATGLHVVQPSAELRLAGTAVNQFLNYSIYDNNATLKSRLINYGGWGAGTRVTSLEDYGDGLWLYATGANPITFYTNGVQRMQVTSAGTVSMAGDAVAVGKVEGDAGFFVGGLLGTNQVITATLGFVGTGGVLTSGVVESTHATTPFRVSGVTVIDNNKAFVGSGGVSTAGSVNSTHASAPFTVSGFTVIDNNKKFIGVGGVSTSGIINSTHGTTPFMLGATTVIDGTGKFVGPGGVNTTGVITTSGVINTSSAFQVGLVTVIDASKNFTGGTLTMSGVGDSSIGGRLGITTASPAFNLDVAGTGAIGRFGSGTSGIEFRSDDSATGFWIRNNGSSVVISTQLLGLFYGYAGNASLIHHFYTNGAEVLAIDLNGLTVTGKVVGSGDITTTGKVEADNGYYVGGLAGANQVITTGYGFVGSGGINTTGGLKCNGNIGFFTTAAVAQQTVTGSRGGNAALGTLLTALANYGLIINNSTP